MDYLAIAGEINRTRERVGERTAQSDMALDVLAMRLAYGFVRQDTAFDVNTFASTAGVPATATHLVGG